MLTSSINNAVKNVRVLFCKTAKALVLTKKKTVPALAEALQINIQSGV